MSLSGGSSLDCDGLTGLPVRAHFFDRLARAGTASTAVLVDLDDFAALNHGLGYQAADELLVAVAGRIAAEAEEHFSARLGGDEFAVLLDGAHDAPALAERLRRELSLPVALGDGRECSVQVSIGVATGSGQELIRNADLALHQAKGRPGSAVAVFDPRELAREVADAELTHDLHGAVERDELDLAYQPIVDLTTGVVVACEALLRWTHPERGSVPPGVFIPIAERTGQIPALGRWVLERACAEATAWPPSRRDGLPLMVGVNVSVRQALEPGFCSHVLATVARYGLPPERLVVEITESALVEEGSSAIDSLVALTEAGVRVVLDDFGTGYSSLSHLQRLPLDSLKVDREFIDALGRSDAAAGIVKAVLDLAESIGLNAIAEGVETAGQAEMLRALGCTRAQGFLFARPMNSRKIQALLESGEPLPLAAVAA